jgi:hypothetical protein
MLVARALRQPGWLALPLLLGGCAGGAKYVPTAVPVDFPRYHVVEVEAVQAADTWEPVTTGDLHVLRDEIVRRFVARHSKLKMRPTLADSGLATTLLVRAEVRELDRGDEWGRLFVGSGSAAGAMAMHVAFVDRVSGLVVAETDIRARTGSQRYSLMNSAKMAKQIAEAVVRFVENRGEAEPEGNAWMP